MRAAAASSESSQCLARGKYNSQLISAVPR
jgi:hypothetical protein